MVRPVIGVCAALERARWAAWDQPALLVPRSYVDAVQRAGGLALLLAPDASGVEDPDPVLDLLDGLVLIGGNDIAPDLYGAPRSVHTVGTVPERDVFELALIRRALARDLPVLGICRGMQVLNVARGGTLEQHLPDAVGHSDHRRRIGSFDDADHDVRLRAGSLAARAAGECHHATKSHHHQGVDRVGDELAVTGRSTLDELPEAVEDPRLRFALGVQWHPEADPESRVVAALVDEARRGAGASVPRATSVVR